MTLLVRLKAYDPRHGFVLRRFTYRGIKFQQERGWYRVSEEVAKYLRTVRQNAEDPKSPAAFDVLSDEEAKQLELAEQEASVVHKGAADAIKVSEARATTTEDLPENKGARRSKKTKG